MKFNFLLVLYMLRQLVDNTLTDKDTVHSYLDTYEELFKDRKEDTLSLLEIGNDKGGSLKLWLDYFKNASICGIDINHKIIKAPLIKPNEPSRIYLLECDAYDKNNLVKRKFDIIIDDGPHTFISVIKFLFYYLPLLTDDGIAIIEDVQTIACVDMFNLIIEEHFPELKECVSVYDLREKKGRYDDILYVIDKRKRMSA